MATKRNSGAAKLLKWGGIDVTRGESHNAPLIWILLYGKCVEKEIKIYYRLLRPNLAHETIGVTQHGYLSNHQN